MKYNGWTESTLGELCDYVARGITPKYSEANGLIVLNQKCIRDYKVSLELTRLHDINVKKLSDEKRLRKYDVLINSTGVGTAGRVAQWDLSIDATCDSHITIVRPNTNKIDARYFGYAVKAQQALIETFAEGSTGQTEMNRQRLCEEVTIRYPDRKDDQIKIANILSNIDEKIKINTAINENLDQQAQAIFKSWFVDYEPFGGAMPDDWRLCTVSDIIELHDSQRKPLSGNQRGRMEKIYPYYGATSLIDYVDNYLFDGKYLLLGEDGTVIDDYGYPILQYVWGKFWLNNHAHIMTGKRGYNVESLYLFFRQTNIKSIVTGAVQPKINQANLRSIEALLPPLKIMDKFNSLIEPSFDMIRNNHDKNEKLTKLRDTLLPKLMSGEIDVSEVTF